MSEVDHMKIWDIVFDNHMHLREEGFNVEAARQFEHSGGTAFNLVNILDYSLPASGYYESVYNTTLKMAERVRRETGIKVVVTIGPYPLDYIHFKDSVDDPYDFLKSGIDTAISLIEEGKANALGEIGRPHFDTDSSTVDDMNALLEYGMQRAADIGCPVILHTEDLNSESYAGLREMARRSGLDTGKLIKHHAHPQDFSFDSVLMKSVLASRKNVRESLQHGKSFYLETDYVDDRDKPEKVIPADSVPRRAVMIKNEYEYWEEIFCSIFRDLPYSTYGEDAFR